MYTFLLELGTERWMEGLLLTGLLAVVGALVYRFGLHRKLRRRYRRAGRHPYQGDAEDFERLLRF